MIKLPFLTYCCQQLKQTHRDQYAASWSMASPSARTSALYSEACHTGRLSLCLRSCGCLASPLDLTSPRAALLFTYVPSSGSTALGAFGLGGGARVAAISSTCRASRPVACSDQPRNSVQIGSRQRCSGRLVSSEMTSILKDGAESWT